MSLYVESYEIGREDEINVHETGEKSLKWKKPIGMILYFNKIENIIKELRIQRWAVSKGKKDEKITKKKKETKKRRG